MKKYKSQKEFEKEIKNGRFYSEESIDITAFCLDVNASIEVLGDINAWNINAKDINAKNINARNISAWNINAGDIKAGDINAWSINAGNIEAGNISYYEVAFAYQNIKCKSIQGRREHSKHFVLDGGIEIIKEEEVPAAKRVRIKVAGGQIIEGEIIDD